MAFEFINYEREANSVGILTVSRPRALNALNWDTLRELRDFMENVLPSESLRALIVTGAGDKAFVAGADVMQMSQMKASEFQEYIEYGHKVYDLIQNVQTPSIASINGYALGGGCELALACDIRIASEKAKLGFPEAKLGMFPAWGGTQRLTRILGLGKAKELIFTAGMIGAQEALDIGLIEKVVPHEQILDAARQLAGAIAKNGPVAVSAAKVSINSGSEMDLQRALLLERTLISLCLDSKDMGEGLQAFLEKREPYFTGE